MLGLEKELRADVAFEAAVSNTPYHKSTRFPIDASGACIRSYTWTLNFRFPYAYCVTHVPKCPNLLKLLLFCAISFNSNKPGLIFLVKEICLVIYVTITLS